MVDTNNADFGRIRVRVYLRSDGAKLAGTANVAGDAAGSIARPTEPMPHKESVRIPHSRSLLRFAFLQCWTGLVIAFRSAGMSASNGFVLGRFEGQTILNFISCNEAQYCMIKSNEFHWKL